MAGGDFTSQKSLQNPREWMKGLDMGLLASKCTCRKNQISSITNPSVLC